MEDHDLMRNLIGLAEHIWGLALETDTLLDLLIQRNRRRERRRGANKRSGGRTWGRRNVLS